MNSNLDCWKPRPHLVDYACRIIEALCVLWSYRYTDRTIRLTAQVKLNTCWKEQQKQLVPGHELVCTQVFWDSVVTRYPSNGVYRVLAVFETNCSKVEVIVVFAGTTRITLTLK